MAVFSLTPFPTLLLAQLHILTASITTGKQYAMKWYDHAEVEYATKLIKYMKNIFC